MTAISNLDKALITWGLEARYMSLKNISGFDNIFNYARSNGNISIFNEI